MFIREKSGLKRCVLSLGQDSALAQGVSENDV